MNDRLYPAQAVTGAGVGLRSKHIPYVLDELPQVPWLELLADNWLAPGGLTYDHLIAVCERYPVTLHGVGLSLGGLDPLDLDYLSSIKALIRSTGAAWYSEHACFTRHDGFDFHDLCPLPGTEEAVAHLAERIRQTQDFLGQRILLENVSAYVRYHESQLTEVEFLAEVAERADCDLLIDINNFYVNHANHGTDVLTEMKMLPATRIRELHLAGFEPQGSYLVDTHSRPVAEEVWVLYQQAIESWGAIATLIEWDNDLPEWPVLQNEQERASRYMEAHIAAPAVRAV